MIKEQVEEKQSRFLRISNGIEQKLFKENHWYACLISCKLAMKDQYLVRAFIFSCNCINVIKY